MLLGKIIGTVTPAIVYTGLQGVPLLLLQPLNKQQQESGKPLVAADATRQAGQGDLVYYEGGREAAMALEVTFVPVDHAVIGIVDDVNLREDA
ncbi:MAG: EutN/CcmL family microcompartment protein [Calditrichia bacterium]